MKVLTNSELGTVHTLVVTKGLAELVGFLLFEMSIVDDFGVVDGFLVTCLVVLLMGLNRPGVVLFEVLLAMITFSLMISSRLTSEP